MHLPKRSDYVIIWHREKILEDAKLKKDRIEEIAELLDKRGKLSLDQLDDYFPNVSQMTLRRDLLYLEQAGRIIRVRGGAMSVKEVHKVSGEPYTKKTADRTSVV